MPSQDGDSPLRKLFPWLKNLLGGSDASSDSSQPKSTEPQSSGSAAPDANSNPTQEQTPRTQTIPALMGAERNALLQFIRETPLVYGRWREFKALFKYAETAADPELLGALIGRLDAAPVTPEKTPYMPPVLKALGAIVDMKGVGSDLYVLASKPGKIYRFDMTDPLEPILLSNYSVTNGVQFAVSGTQVAVIKEGGSGAKGTLEILEWAEGNSPRQVGACIVHRPKQVVLMDRYALVICNQNYSNDQMHVVDISNPANPQEVGTMRLERVVAIAASNQRVLVVQHEYYNVTSTRIFLVDLSNPAHPRQLHTHSLTGITALATAGNYAYAVTEDRWGNTPGKLCVLELMQNKLSSVTELKIGRAKAITLNGDRAYVLTGRSSTKDAEERESGLKIVDISDPKRPRLKVRVKIPNPERFAVCAGKAFTQGSPSQTADTALYGIDLTDLTKPFPFGISPSRETIAYLKRRGTRLLRNLEKTDPDTCVQLAFHTLRASGRGLSLIDPQFQWVSMELLYGGSDRYFQRSHGRGAYALKNARFVRNTREERGKDAWDRHPDLARILLQNPDLPWQTHEAAFKILGAAPSEIAALPESQLGCFLSSASPLLITAATREVLTCLEAAQDLAAKPVAEAYYLGGSGCRRRLEALLTQGDRSPQWIAAFALRLCELVTVWKGTLSRRQATGLLTLVRSYPSTLSGQMPPELVVALFASEQNELIDWAISVIQQVRPSACLQWLELLAAESVSAQQREAAVVALLKSISVLSFSYDQALQLIYSSYTWVRQAGWMLLGASRTAKSTMSVVWQKLLDTDSSALIYLIDALGSPAALALLAREEALVNNLLAVLEAQPELGQYLPGGAFATLLGQVAPATVLKLITATPEERWAERQETLVIGLRQSTQIEAFWKAAWTAISNDQSGLLARRLLDDPEIVQFFLPLTDPDYLKTTNPVFGPLLSRWVRMHAALFPADSPGLMLAATHALPEVRAWGLERVETLGMEMPFALRLLESELPACVERGKAFFEALPPEDEQAIEWTTALCDSPKSSVRNYGREYLSARWEALPQEKLFAYLVENSDPQMQHFVAAWALNVPPPTEVVAEFDRAVLRGRNRGRHAKELVKQRLTQTVTETPFPDIPTLLEMARSRTPRDAEWALQQLVKLALAGHVIEGLAVQTLPGE